MIKKNDFKIKLQKFESFLKLIKKMKPMDILRFQYIFHSSDLK